MNACRASRANELRQEEKDNVDDDNKKEKEENFAIATN